LQIPGNADTADYRAILDFDNRVSTFAGSPVTWGALKDGGALVNCPSAPGGDGADGRSATSRELPRPSRRQKQKKAVTHRFYKVDM